MKHEILLGLTTTPASDWRGKVEEMKKFGIKRIALFPTFLNVEERRELYTLLEQIGDLEVPHVHLREQDMEEWEMELYGNKFKTEVYNIHKSGNNKCLEKYRRNVFIENRFKPFEKNHMDGYGGMCADFSHLEDGRRRRFSRLDPVWNLLDEVSIGCCHVSAIKSNEFNLINQLFGFDRHYFRKLSDFDYIEKYRQYLPKYISLELENDFAEQLEAKKYLEKILDLS